MKPTRRRTFKQSERLLIYQRDKYKCQLCGKDLTDIPNDRIIDHKVPLKLGGSNKFKNVWLLCYECDNNKSDKLIPQAVLTIKNKKIRHYYFNIMLRINKQY